jgi:hypothetical protein
VQSLFFPKLELLHIIGNFCDDIGMRNMESWSLNIGNFCDDIEVEYDQLVLMPSL